MPCFCTVPADAARSFTNIGPMPILPSAPLALRLGATLPALDQRLDMQIAAAMPMALPDIQFGSAGLSNIAMMLNMMSGTFTLDDLPMLQFEMDQAAASLVNNVWPRLGWLTELKLQPLLNFAIIARLVIDMSDFGLDPFNMNSFPLAPMRHSLSFGLTKPQLKMAKLYAGLPPLMQLSTTLDLPPLGDDGAVSMARNYLQNISQLTPPSLAIPLPILTKLAMVLESLGTIQTAFGDGFSPMTLSRIDAMLTKFGAMQIPIPLAALALRQQLDLLPPLDAIVLGQQMATSFPFATMNFSPPKLAIAPFMNLILGLQASLQYVVDLPVFDQCSTCAFG